MPTLRLLFLGLLAALPAVAASLDFNARSRRSAGDPLDTNRVVVANGRVSWDPAKTAVVVCDMWDRHHCPDATARVGEMVPRMNAVLKEARSRGALIIHCPSDTMDFYKDHPGRKLAQSALKVATLIPLEGWCSLKPDREAALPIDDSDGGCDGCPDCPSFKAWKSQHPGLEIADGDAVTDSAEAFYLMKQRGITNVLVMGVHINMCVLGRPFSIRQMVRQGQNVLLVRDLTDSMYNHRRRPFVNHFRGTELVVEHIEQYWCPSVTSADLLGGEPHRFQADKPKHVVIVVGENEYRTWETLPEFAGRELEWRGIRTSWVMSSTNQQDHGFRNWEVLKDADAVVLSVRRRGTPEGMMRLLREHVAQGKPLVSLRTSLHAFELREGVLPPGRGWKNMDEEVLGVDYQDHYGAGPAATITTPAAMESHPILRGVPRNFVSKHHLYRIRNPAGSTTVLLQGRLSDGSSQTEPVAWINTAGGRRIFGTSLGGPEDFSDPAFRRLLRNGILWTLDEFIAPEVAGR
jgi:nicotinamidase-related amidase